MPGVLARAVTGGRIAQTSIDEVVERADLLELASARTDLKRSGARRVQRSLPVPRRAHAVVLGQPAQEDLLLLRLPAQGRRDPLRDGDAVARASWRRWSGLPSATASSSCASAPIPPTMRAVARAARLHELLELAATFYRRYLRESPAAAGARAYLAGRGISAGGRRALPDRLRAGGVGARRDRRPVARLQRGRAGGRGAGAARAARPPVARSTSSAAG